MRVFRSFLIIGFLAVCSLSVTLLWGKETQTAVAKVESLSDSGVKGRVAFTAVKDGVLVIVEVSGLTPGKHGFHIHEFGDCSSPDGKSAGGHYNPFNKPHGAPNNSNRHVGDLGNIIADKEGKVYYEFVDTIITLNGPYSIIGKSVVIHQKADDLTSQPSGDAGSRIGCGVIKAH